MRKSAALLALSSLPLAGCITAIDKYFKDKEVNRLALPRTDVRPGRLLIAKDNKLRLSDDIIDIVPNASLTTQGFEVVFSAGEYSGEIKPSMGLSVVDAVLPLGLNSKVTLKSSAKIDQIDAHGVRLPSTAVTSLFAGPAGPPLKQWLESHARDATIGIVLETYSAREINMSSSSGTDITSSVNLGEIKAFKTGSVGFDVSRSTKNTLTIKGDIYYVFGLKAYAFEFESDGKFKKLSDAVLDLTAPMKGKGPVLGGPSPTPTAPRYGPVVFDNP